MKKTLKYRYSLKRALPMLALAGAGLMASCEKKTDDPYAGYIDPVKVLKFGDCLGLDSIQYDNVMKYANDPRITKIIYFLDSVNDNNNMTGFTKKNISEVRGILQERLDYTSKATGAGNFEFIPGRTLIEDSLWFVANGWTINKQNQR